MIALAFDHLPAYVRAWWKLRRYEPQKVTRRLLRNWVNQFPKEHRSILIRLAANIRFLSKQETIRSLVELNKEVLRALSADEITMKNVIYVSTDTAGSSSGVMLNLLRNHANLERRGAHLLDSRDLDGIRKKTRKLRTGAIIYVDDFSATGNQFIESRDIVFNSIEGAFSEFFLLPCVCEEAHQQITAKGVEPRASILHLRSERPLREECDFISAKRREELLTLSLGYWPRKWSLGYGGLATNVVFYSNAPNTTPLIFRGSIGQSPVQGIVPRFNDLSMEDA